MAKSTGSGSARKPTKPRPDFPLFPHASGRWAKKIRGKFHYFGKVSGDTNGEAALALWVEQKDALLAGRVPKKRTGDELTIQELANRYLTAKERLLNAGELAHRTFGEYFSTATRVAKWFGAARVVSNDEISTDDWGEYRSELAKTRGPVALGNEIVRTRSLFKFAYDERLIQGPILFGQQFSKPAGRVYTKVEAESGDKDFAAEEIRKVLSALSGLPVEVDGEETTYRASPVMKAAVMLAINAGFGQHDISGIPLSAFDLEEGWVRFPRPKTGVARQAKLWPETVDAMKVAIKNRPAPKSTSDEHLAFLNSKGKRFIRGNESDDPSLWKSRTDILGKVFGGWLKRLGVGGRRGFYGLRHTFQTVAETSMDFPIVKFVMGHTDSSMSARYRGKDRAARLENVAEVVRKWLFG